MKRLKCMIINFFMEILKTIVFNKNTFLNFLKTTKMKNILLLATILFLGACSSKYDKSEENAAPYEDSKEKTESSQVLKSEMNEQPSMDESSVVDQTKKVNRERSTTQTSNFRNKTPESLTDTLYLNSVRLSKKFIKTADLRFKVNNVEKTTAYVESLALKLGGYIHKSHIKSNYVSSRNIEISSDTIMDVLEYYVDNNMIIRVPNIYFDSVLTEIGELHIYLDHREVNTKDVSTTFLKNKLKEEKRTEYEKRIQKAVDIAPRKLDDIVEAERQASELADMAIDKKIANYELQDEIDFSTISLNFYQSNSIYKEYVQNTILTEFQPNFWQKAWKAIKTGWKVILEIIVGLLYIWPLYILAIIVYYGIRYFNKRTKK